MDNTSNTQPSMKASELIATVGDQNVQVQWLHQCAVAMDYDPDHALTIRFRTKAASMADLHGVGQPPRRVAMIVWMDAADVNDAVQLIQQASRA